MEKTSKRTPRSLEGDFKREKKSPPVKSQEDYYNPKRASRRRLIAAAGQKAEGPAAAERSLSALFCSKARSFRLTMPMNTVELTHERGKYYGAEKVFVG